MIFIHRPKRPFTPLIISDLTNREAAKAEILEFVLSEEGLLKDPAKPFKPLIINPPAAIPLFFLQLKHYYALIEKGIVDVDDSEICAIRDSYID